MLNESVHQNVAKYVMGAIHLFIYVKRKQSTSAPGTTKNTDFTVRRLSLQQQETLDIVRTTQSSMDQQCLSPQYFLKVSLSTIILTYQSDYLCVIKQV